MSSGRHGRLSPRERARESPCPPSSPPRSPWWPCTRPFRRWFADDRVRAESRREVAYETLARIPIGTALFEEVAFRGVLTGLLLRTMAAGPAYAVSSAVFGLWHVLPTLRDHAGESDERPCLPARCDDLGGGHHRRRRSGVRGTPPSQRQSRDAGDGPCHAQRKCLSGRPTRTPGDTKGGTDPDRLGGIGPVSHRLTVTRGRRSFPTAIAALKAS